MRLKLQLPAKAGRFHIFECEAVRLVTLPDEEFQDFLNGPHQDGRWAAEPFYADEHGRRIYQGVLVLGEGHKDGVFAYDGGKHFAYLPGARAVVDSILEQAVEKIIREGAENTNEGSWCYYFSELYEQMGLVIEDGNGFDTMLLEKLEQRPEAADVTLTDECFDVCYYLDYCKNLAPEQPAPSLSAERKEEIISGILNYMAEYFDDSSLYDILHNTLEICNDEIGCLGFALYDEYVDEQIEASEVQSDLLPKSGKLVNLLSAYEELQQTPTVTNRMDRAWGKQGPPCCGSRRKKGWRFGCRKRRSVNFIDFPQLLKPLFIGNDEWISLRKCGIVLLHGQPTGA